MERPEARRRRGIVVVPGHIGADRVVHPPGSGTLSVGSGSVTVECAVCGHDLARGLGRDEFMNVVVECPRCGRLNLVV